MFSFTNKKHLNLHIEQVRLEEGGCIVPTCFLTVSQNLDLLRVTIRTKKMRDLVER